MDKFDYPHIIIVVGCITIAMSEPLYFSHDCKVTERGREYSGDQSHTASGHKCKDWRQTGYRYKDEDELMKLFPMGDIEHNHCRNPSGRIQGPWCYVDYKEAGVHWEYCHVEECGDYFVSAACTPPTTSEPSDGKIHLACPYQDIKPSLIYIDEAFYGIRYYKDDEKYHRVKNTNESNYHMTEEEDGNYSVEDYPDEENSSVEDYPDEDYPDEDHLHRKRRSTSKQTHGKLMPNVDLRQKREVDTREFVCSFEDPRACTQDFQFDRKAVICNTEQECAIDADASYLKTCNKKSEYMQIQYDCIPGSQHDLINICSDQVYTTQLWGFLHSPGYPEEDYHCDTDCSCHITTRGHAEIEFEILDMDIEYGDKCQFDWLEVRYKNGRMRNMRKACGRRRNRYSVVFETHMLDVRLLTDGNTRARGFWIRFRGVDENGHCVPSKVVCGKPKPTKQPRPPPRPSNYPPRPTKGKGPPPHPTKPTRYPPQPSNYPPRPTNGKGPKPWPTKPTRYPPRPTIWTWHPPKGTRPTRHPPQTPKWSPPQPTEGTRRPPQPTEKTEPPPQPTKQTRPPIWSEPTEENRSRPTASTVNSVTRFTEPWETLPQGPQPTINPSWMLPQAGKQNSNEGIIAGAVLGSLLGLVILTAVGIILFKRYYDKSHPLVTAPPPPPAPENNDGSVNPAYHHDHSSYVGLSGEKGGQAETHLYLQMVEGMGPPLDGDMSNPTYNVGGTGLIPSAPMMPYEPPPPYSPPVPPRESGAYAVIDSGLHDYQGVVSASNPPAQADLFNPTYQTEPPITASQVTVHVQTQPETQPPQETTTIPPDDKRDSAAYYSQIDNEPGQESGAYAEIDNQERYDNYQAVPASQALSIDTENIYETYGEV